MADVQKAALKKAAGVSEGKDECQVRLKGKEHDYWMGTEVGMLGGYGFNDFTLLMTFSSRYITDSFRHHS